MGSVSPAVYRIHPDGSHLEKISDEYTAGLSWTPDGQWLTYTNSIDRYEERGIFRMRPDGSQTEQIYEGPAEYFAWSPDSQYIAFTQWENLYWMTADGSEVQQLTDSPVSIWSPVWSPTGEWIVFAAGHKGMEHGGGYDSDVYIYQIRPDGSGMRRLHQGEHWRDIWANDWTPFYCEPYLCAQTDTEILYFEDGWNITWTPEVSHE
jgi:Tol biopolymer transport system component